MLYHSPILILIYVFFIIVKSFLTNISFLGVHSTSCFIFCKDIYIYIICIISLDDILSGIDLTANQDDLTDHETFQLEFQKSSGKWLIRSKGDKSSTTSTDKYWKMDAASKGIQNIGSRR